MAETQLPYLYPKNQRREERISAQGIPKTRTLINKFKGKKPKSFDVLWGPGPTKKEAKEIFLAKLKPLLMDNLLSKIPDKFAPELDEMITSSIIEGVDSIQQENTFFENQDKGWPDSMRLWWEWGKTKCVDEIRSILADKIRDFKIEQETTNNADLRPNPLPLHSTPKSYIAEKIKRGGRKRRRKRKSRRKSRRKRKSRRRKTKRKRRQ